MIVAERREFDIDLPDNADLDARHGGALDLGEIRKDLLVILLGVGEGFRLQRGNDIQRKIGGNMDFIELAKKRYSVRSYSDKKVE